LLAREAIAASTPDHDQLPKLDRRRQHGRPAIAALLITEFQLGVNKEADLTMAFVGDGSLRLHVPVGRLSRLMGNRLFGWEEDVGQGARVP
jgi:hypothetical protein